MWKMRCVEVRLGFFAGKNKQYLNWQKVVGALALHTQRGGSEEEMQVGGRKTDATVESFQPPIEAKQMR